jgi:hypothetical protein
MLRLVLRQHATPVGRKDGMDVWPRIWRSMLRDKRNTIAFNG